MDKKELSELEKQIMSGRSSFVLDKEVDYVDESETVSPFTTEVKGPAKASIEKIHQGRTERAQTVDEQYNAPVTTDEEKWVENKNRYDYPGVDTIPRERLGKRSQSAAKKLQERKAVDRVEQKGSAKNLQGKFSPKGQKTYGREKNVARVQDTAKQPERTLAHELGHAADYDTGEDGGFKLTTKLFELDTPTSQGETEELTNQAKTISKKARGDFKRQPSYRRQYTELTADVVGQAIIEPQATKRDAPELFERLEETAEKEGFGDIFGDESDPADIF